MLALVAAAGAVSFALASLTPGQALAQGSGSWLKFLFTPQAGYNSACLSCGWHSGACGTTWGPALDVPGNCSDGGYQVYFRSFGFKPSGTQEWVAWGMPFTDPDATCKTTYVNIYDRASNHRGTMTYVHTYRTRDTEMRMYVDEYGWQNEYVFAGMARDPELDGGVPDDEKENQLCKDLGWWTGRHVHELHADEADTFFLRDGGSCESGKTYPCGPQSLPYPTYDPQDWWNDWARGFCIDDTDCDGWTDDQEQGYLGTDPLDACPDNPSHDAWPPDLDNDRDADIVDVLKFKPYVLTSVPPSPPRFDLDTDGDIDIVDVMKYKPIILTSCTP